MVYNSFAESLFYRLPTHEHTHFCRLIKQQKKKVFFSFLSKRLENWRKKRFLAIVKLFLWGPKFAELCKTNDDC